MIKRNKYDYVVGIDPDVDGSGVGVVFHSIEIRKYQFSLPELIEYLKGIINKEGPVSMKVVIEAGWMNKGNHHLKNKGQHHASKIGENVGRNHELGKQIGVCCDYYGIPYEFVPPLRKSWKGKNGKITNEELRALMEGSVPYPYSGQTNQDTRDAILLAMVHSGIPLIMAHK